MCKGSHIAVAVKHHFLATAQVAHVLSAYFQLCFPEAYEQYREAFEAGIWLVEDPGPWLGRVIVYKLQVKPHVDRLDAGPTAIFNVGQYEGGELYIPCLNLKFQ
jgi:hypothetical protein